MTRRHLLLILAGLWLAVYAASFIAFFTTDATGDSFTRGLNRIVIFLLWQLAAGFPGSTLGIVGRQASRGPGLRWLLRRPVALGLALIAGIAAILIWGQ